MHWPLQPLTGWSEPEVLLGDLSSRPKLVLGSGQPGLNCGNASHCAISLSFNRGHDGG